MFIDIQALVEKVDGHADMFRPIGVASAEIVRHVKVRAKATPNDPDYTSYFERWQSMRRSHKHEELWHPRGTIRRDYLNRLFFWNAQDLERRLVAFQHSQ